MCSGDGEGHDGEAGPDPGCDVQSLSSSEYCSRALGSHEQACFAGRWEGIEVKGSHG